MLAHWAPLSLEVQESGGPGMVSSIELDASARRATPGRYPVLWLYMADARNRDRTCPTCADGWGDPFGGLFKSISRTLHVPPSMTCMPDVPGTQ